MIDLVNVCVREKMEENRRIVGWRKDASHWLLSIEEDDEEMKGGSVPQPPTPKEPMDFLSRSWSLSASEISKALLAQKQKHAAGSFDKNVIPETDADVVAQNHLSRQIRNGRKTGAIGRWFNPKEYSISSSSSSGAGVQKKDKARLENAHMHAVLSVAGLAAAVAAVAAADKDNDSNTNSASASALASATELLASHCIEMAESAGVEHQRLAAVVRSAIDIRTATHLLTLTAAAATALRGEAALKARLPREAKRNAAISPCDKAALMDAYPPATNHKQMEEDDPHFEGDLLQITRKGLLRWKHVSVYINKNYQVVIKLKSKHVGGAFSKKNKSIVYEVFDDTTAWPFKKEKENGEIYFGVRTAQALLEFKCKNKIHRQKWLDGIQNLLHRASSIEESDNSLRMLNINKSI